MSILPKNIRYLRKKNEWSQDYIAEKLGYKSLLHVPNTSAYYDCSQMYHFY